MSSIRLKYVQQWVDGEARVHRYFRRPGSPRVRLPGLPGSDEFMAAYQAALGAMPAPIGAKRTLPGSLDGALTKYLVSREFVGLRPGRKALWRPIFERWRIDDGDKPLARLPREYINRRLSGMKPHAARNWLKAARHFLRFCVAN